MLKCLAGETEASPPACVYSAARRHCAYEYISAGNRKTWPVMISRHTDRTGTWRLPAIIRDVMNARHKTFWTGLCRLILYSLIKSLNHSDYNTYHLHLNIKITLAFCPQRLYP
jgi:hypothetical protein